MENLPLELVQDIFKYFDTKTLLACMFVNIKWRQITEQAVEVN